MNKKPLVSIIIPTYNRAHLIGETLDSIVAQTYQNWECIVVDDGSTDATDTVMLKYCEKDARFKYFHRPEQHLPGGNGARNYGFKMCQGEYVQWFDSDDLMLPEKIDFQVTDLLNTSKKVHLCSGVRFYTQTKSFKDLRVDFDSPIFCQIALNTTEIMTPSMLIEREIFFNSEIEFHEELTRAQETYFLINLVSVIDNNFIFQSDKKLFKYIIHEQSISKSDEIYNANHVNSKAIVFSKIWKLNKAYKCKDLSNKMYRKNIRLLFSSLRNKDYKISKFILKILKINLKPENSKIYIRVLIYYIILRIFSKPNYRLRNKLLNIKIII